MAYDSRAVKVPKSVKRIADTFTDNAKRRAYIRSFVKILEEQSKGRRKDSN